MIVQMNKYSFVLLSADVPRFIEGLQNLGMVDITRQNKAIDETSKNLSQKLKAIQTCYTHLEYVEKEASDRKEIPVPLPFQGGAEDLLEQSARTAERSQQLKTRLNACKSLLAEAKPWGDFSSADLQRLEQMQLRLQAYAVPEKRFDKSWEKAWPLQIISVQNGKIFFVVLTPLNQAACTLPLPERSFPARSYPAIEAEIEAIRKEIESCDGQMLALAQHRELLTAYSRPIAASLDRYLAEAGGRKEAEDYLSVFTGFAPREDSAALDQYLDSQCLYYIEEKARQEDDPPIRLKNNWFFRLFEPIGDMYMLPVYDELDLTPLFGPFYMLFFGLCLGDMGYGLIILLIGIFGRFFLPKMKQYLNLAVFLGLGAIAASSLSGSFFGLALKDYIPALAGKEGGILTFTNMQMFWTAILFGIFQILFARVVGAIDACVRRGWQAGMAGFGWTFLILWCVLAYAATMVPALKMDPVLSGTLIGLGVLLILFFTKTSGPLYKRIFSGIAAFYDITGIFGDILSYIRLFGLGTAGGILALVMNQIANSLTGIPYIGYLLGVLILLIGHTLVFALSVLGALVHPMRLTFVEFYKNIGFTGGGRPYRPLRK